MSQLLSTKTHGAVDYAWISVATTAQSVMTGADATARLLRSAGSAVGFMALLTNYEAGFVRLLPMRAHLAIDFIMGAALLLSPLMLPKKERRFALVPMALGAATLTASLFTETDTTARLEPFSPSYELAEAVADPDVARAPHLRNHLE
jgi:hypothetical protein